MRVLALLAIAACAAGCSLGGEDDAASVQPSELAKLVLQPEDLPREFIQFDEGRQGASDLPQSGERAGPDRFGRQEGWKARYRRRSGGARVEGPLVVSSLVDVFESSGGAQDDFEALGSSLREGGIGWQPAEAPELGDEALAMRLVQGSPPAEVRFFVVGWREGNTVSTVEVNGFELELADAVALARKQAARVAAAA